MVARLRSWWQKIKQHSFIATGIIIIPIAIIALIFTAYSFGWSGTGFLNKTLWDWLQLLIIPVVLLIIAYLFNRATSRKEHRIAFDNQRETALQDYIDKMSELLLEKNLSESKPDSEVRKIAEARTWTMLLRLDADRKRSLVRFLYQSNRFCQN